MDADQGRRARYSAYDGATPNTVNTARSSALQPNIDRGYEINQVNTSGNVDIT